MQQENHPECISTLLKDCDEAGLNRCHPGSAFTASVVDRRELGPICGVSHSPTRSADAMPKRFLTAAKNEIGETSMDEVDAGEVRLEDLSRIGGSYEPLECTTALSLPSCNPT